MVKFDSRLTCAKQKPNTTDKESPLPEEDPFAYIQDPFDIPSEIETRQTREAVASSIGSSAGAETRVSSLPRPEEPIGGHQSAKSNTGSAQIQVRSPSNTHKVFRSLASPQLFDHNFGFVKYDSQSDEMGSVATPRSGHSNPSLYEDLSCDYDNGPTTLYQLLESSDWEMAITRCRTHPNEVRTWVVRKEGAKLRWKLLPIHAAVIFQSPTGVVKALLEKYPGAASRVDDQGMLPLHLAFRHKAKDQELLELFLVQYPKGVLIEDGRGRTPIEHRKDGLFSTKIMGLYAASVLAASTAVPVTNKLPAKQETQAKVDYEGELAAMREAYEQELVKMKNMYEDQIAVLQEQNERSLVYARMGEREDGWDNTLGPQDEIYGEQREEILRLKADFEHVRRDKEMLSTLLRGERLYAQEVTDNLHRVVEDQKRLKDLLGQQYEELEAAHEMRDQLLKSLLQQENDRQHLNRGGVEMTELSDSIQKRLEQLLSRAPPSDDPYDDQRHLDDISGITEGEF